MDLLEGVGESSSPPRSFGGYSSHDIRTDVYNRLVETGHDEAVSNPDFREQLEAHFNRLPPSYGLDVNVDRAEDVLVHRNLLDLARDPDKRPVYHIRLLENISTRTDGEDQEIVSTHTSPELSSHTSNGGVVASNKRTRDLATEFEPCSKLEDLNLDVIKNSKETKEKIVTDSFSQSSEIAKRHWNHHWKLGESQMRLSEMIDTEKQKALTESVVALEAGRAIVKIGN